MGSRMRTIAATGLMLLSGCQSIPVGVKLPDMPSSLLTECLDHSQLPEQFNLRDVLMSHTDDVQALDTCRTRHKTLSDWVRNLYDKQGGQ